MKILALDLATTTGWASGSAKPIYGHQTFKETHRPAKLCLFGVWLENILGRERPDLVGYEIPILRGGAADTLLKAMAGITEATAHGCGAAVAPACRPSQLKKFWTGSGKAEKADMIACWHWLKANAVAGAA